MLGEWSTTTIFFLVGVVTAILLYLLFISLRNPVLAKLGLRNMARRPAQTILIIIGLTLSTVIIISALGTGDTLRYSVQRQAVAAYGKVDEIIAPPLLSMLATLGNPNADTTQVDEARSTLSELMRGGLDSVLALVNGGLPSISMDRLESLRTEAAAEPLIDGVSGAVVFPTIIRNVGTGQSEPIGFVFAVDNEYPEIFSLKSVDGRPLTMQELEPGIGNIFLQASNLFAVIPQLTGQFSNLTSGLTPDQQGGVAQAAQILAAVGAIFTGIDPSLLPDTAIALDTFDELGIDTAPLRALGRDTISLRELAAIVRTVAPGGSFTETLPLGTQALISNTAALSATLATVETAVDEGGGAPVTDTMSALSGVSSQLLQAINLNTIGSELDRSLAPLGLQLRQGDLYLNRLGAQQLNANPGDLLEIYIGPLPVRFRVRAVVDEAGPLSALLPVVMLRLDEAQKLFFMNDKINAVLVSNTGDEMTGMQHTDAVSKRLRVLALDRDAVDTVRKTLADPAVRAVLETAVPDLPESPSVLEDEEDVPPLIAGFLDQMLRSFNVEQMTHAEGEALLATLTTDDDNAALRELLAKMAVREWLISLSLPVAQARTLTTAVSNLNQFEQIDALNKTTIVAAANVGGGVFSSIFSIFGVFSILAALLLIVLIFVMLAAERRVEIGVAHAIGVQRSQVAQMLLTEGMVYNLLAGALGVLLGVGITFAMTQFIGQLFNDLTGQINAQAGGVFSISFNISWQSMVAAYCLGVLITWLAMTFSTSRVTRMNIVTAIRNLPDEAESKRRSRLGNLWSWIFPLLVAGLGFYLFTLALSTQSLSIAMIAATVTLYGVTVLIGHVLEVTPMRNETGYRIVYTLLGLGLIAIWIVPWYSLAPQLAPGVFQWDPTQAPTVFMVGGPMIITGAILAIMFNADFLSSLFSTLFGFIPSLRPVLKTAIAYPLSTRFRTGMTMVLFAMIMATVVVMAVIVSTTQSLIRLDVRQTAGFDIEVSPTLLSFFSPIDDFPAAVAALPDPKLRDEIAAVGLVTEQLIEGRLSGAGQSYASVGMAGVNQGYADQAASIYRLGSRAPGFADDAAVWRAMAERDDVVVVRPELFEAVAPVFGPPRFGSGAGMTDDETQPERMRRMRGPRLQLAASTLVNGQLPELYLELTNTATDGVTRNHRVQVIGVLAEDANLVQSELIGSAAALARLRSVPVTGDRIYVKAAAGVEAAQVAAGIESAFVASGLNASVLAESYAQRQRLTGGALQLLQGFMALGLLVGIAALGVISTRSVIERRQQVGMLRALGYQSSMVGLSFLLEASFIAITGLVIGALTGVVLGANIVDAFFPQIDASVVATPWGQIGLMVLAAYLFSLLTTLVPAWQASRIYPADALRYE